MLISMFFMFAFCYIVGSLFVWGMLKLITQNFRFRQQAAPDDSRARPKRVVLSWSESQQANPDDSQAPPGGSQANLSEKQAVGTSSASPVIASAIMGAAFALPFIPAHPAPDVGNWIAMMDRTSMLVGAYGLLSLVCWIVMAVRPTLLTLYIAINGMILCGLGVCLLLLIGAASPA